MDDDVSLARYTDSPYAGPMWAYTSLLPFDCLDNDRLTDLTAPSRKNSLHSESALGKNGGDTHGKHADRPTPDPR